ncbi:hypothetical protein PMPD1_0024 [Paramixta manurensis]|uniref:Glutamine amidotransferase type-2 domain-containing protein n=1 Tax=Paramixta manurensis TaxID=2740817 RepID=A0A6M8U693_9GAMM|nr:hypothetical protein PMPD1_0024 [Erwiniaceae bacterium PD-1]
MCRMIMAHGDFSVAEVIEAARAMSCGETAQHEGLIKQHPNGWGCLWLDNGQIRTLHGTGRFADALPELNIKALQTRLLAIHVRHATLSKNSGIQFSHPLLRQSGGTQWYMMHNGFLPTIYQNLGLPASQFDSAEYLEYVVDGVTPSDFTQRYLQEKMANVAPGGSAGNAFFFTDQQAWAWQWHPDDTPYPHYFTLHCCQNTRSTIIASEQIPALGAAAHWHRMSNHQLHEITFAE